MKKISKIKLIKRLVELLIFLMLIFFVSLIIYNKYLTDNIKITLIGSETIDSVVNEEYNDLGFKVKRGNTILSNNLVAFKKESNVDITKLGSYDYKYIIYYHEKKYELKRKVNIIDNIAPLIESSDTYKKFKCNNNELTNFYYKVIDNYDGDITEKIEYQEKDNIGILTARDSSGNVSIKEIPIIYTDTPPPTLKLNGNDTIYIKIGTDFNDPGVILEDACGKKINGNINITNNINNNKEGNYEVVYTYEDTKIVRKVNVYEKIYLEPSNGDGKVVYLTFDDGPGIYTSDILDILKKYNVKATFFVTDQFPSYRNILTREKNEGHTVAVHSLKHKWEIYKSVDLFINDFNQMNDIINEYTGEKTKLFRFIGGSSNTVSKNYATGVVSAISSKMTSLGNIYFDWNVDSGDASYASSDKIYENVVNGIKSRETSVVLMHDIQKNTLYALENIIVYGLENGYTFASLDENSYTAHHGIAN